MNDIGLLKFYEVIGSRASELFKGKIRGPEYPESAWVKVVTYFNRNGKIKTLVVSGGRLPKLNFEFDDKVFSMSITEKTLSRDVIEWVEKLMRMYSKLKEPVVETIEVKSNNNVIVQEHGESSRNSINVVAGGSMIFALCAFVGAAVGSVIAEQEDEYDQKECDFLFVDDDDKPIDFRVKAQNEKDEKILEEKNL